MSGDHLVKLATGTAVDVVRGVQPNQLAHSTPCADFTVQGLLNHLLFWGPSLEGAARKETVPPPEGKESEVDLTDGWQGKLVTHFEQLAKSWSEPAAWQGTTHVGGPTEMPAELVGGMVLTEVVVHGTDLARATGQTPNWDDDLLAYVHEQVVATAQLGRDMGAYGPEVSVPADAPVLDRLLGLTGREPLSR